MPNLEPTHGLFGKVADGCHRYGWLINLFAVVVFWSYTAGSLSERVTALEKRMDRLEAQALQISQDALVRSDRLERRMGDLEIQILRAGNYFHLGPAR